MVLPQQSTTKRRLDELQQLTSHDVLAHPKLGHELPTDTRARIPLNRYVKASFAIHEARYVRFQPFLLIGRTCRIFTALGVHDRSVRRGCVTILRERVAQDTSAIPAYGQVYRQRGYPLSHDVLNPARVPL
jgi:hypothetical protein